MLTILIAGAAVAALAPAPVGVHQYASVALSPDGARVASVDSVEIANATKQAHGHVVVRAATDGRIVAEYDPCPACSYSGLHYSPDGRSLAFAGQDVASGRGTLFVGHDATAASLAALTGLLAEPRWSRDGTTIAMLVVPNARKATGPREPGAAIVGEVGTQTDSRRIAIIPAAGGGLTMVTPAGRYVYEYDWCPGGGFAVIAADGDGDNNWWVAKLYGVNAAGTMAVIAAPPYQMDHPRVSADGRSVAFIGGVMSDFGSVGGEVYSVPIAGGTPVSLTPGFKGTITALGRVGDHWRANALVAERAMLVDIDATGAMTTLMQPVADSIDAGDMTSATSADGRTMAVVSQNFSRAPAVLAGGATTLRAITHDNDALPVAVTGTSVTWTGDAGPVQGWLLRAAGTIGATRGPAPLIVSVHGGPAAASTPRFVSGGMIPQLTRAGYALLLPNPRGSYGRGLAFQAGNHRDFGGGDWRDIMGGVDRLVADKVADPERLGLMGGSYGGYMTMWGVTQTTRFKAAWAAAGIANWQSYYGQNGIDQWMVPFFGATAYDDPEVYRRLSPIDGIKRVRTPVLITVGERDVECPPAQSIEYWHGLRAFNVPTSLVVYPGAGHRISDPVQQLDVANRVVAWFDRYLSVSRTTRR